MMAPSEKNMEISLKVQYDQSNTYFFSDNLCPLMNDHPAMVYVSVVFSILILLVDNSYLKEAKFRRKTQ